LFLIVIFSITNFWLVEKKIEMNLQKLIICMIRIKDDNNPFLLNIFK